jgi:type IV pilus assembly protein PilF
MRLTALASLLLLVTGCAHGPSAKQRQTAEIHHDLGVEALRGGRAQDALREFDEALQIDPDFPEAHLGRGLVLEYAFDKLVDAESEYRSALAEKVAYSEAHNDLGQLLARTGRYEEALKEFDLALENTFYMEPWVARCNRGLTLHRMGRRDEGLAELRACLNTSPRYCQGRRELGRILMAEGKLKEAIAELDAYARVCDKVADAHYQLGMAYMKSGDLPAAKERFERCESLAGTTPVAEDCRKSLLLLQ